MYVIAYKNVYSGGSSELVWETYTNLKNLQFAPESDVTGNSLPVNQFTVDIVTTDDMSEWQYCELMDDMNQRWAYYDVRKAERIDPSTVRFVAQSRLYRLDAIEMEETVYVNASSSTVIAACFGGNTGWYALHSDLRNIEINGYCPTQTGRERLLWVCLAIGAHVRDLYADVIGIRPIDNTEALIPYGKTFSRPAIEYGNWVTGVRVTSYTFTQGSEAQWQASDSSYKFPLPWVATEQTVELSNPYAPEDADENVVEISEVYLINSANASDICSRLARCWFRRETVQLDCINNRAYRTGELLTGYVDSEHMVTGFASSITFKFGKQARSTIKLIGCDTTPSASLTVKYKRGNKNLGSARYRFPLGFEYSIQNPYLDQIRNGHRYIYRPETPTTTGTIPSIDPTGNGFTVTVQYDIALDFYRGTLYVISADEVTTTIVSGESIGVIT